MAPSRRTNGEPVTRAELGAHLDSFDKQLASLCMKVDRQFASLNAKVDAIAEKVLAPQRWFGRRLTVLVDRGLIIAVTAVLAYIATHS